MICRGGFDFECKFEHEPAEPRTWDEPGYPAINTLVSAVYQGVEVLGMLDPAIVQELEANA